MTWTKMKLQIILCNRVLISNFNKLFYLFFYMNVGGLYIVLILYTFKSPVEEPLTFLCKSLQKECFSIKNVPSPNLYISNEHLNNPVFMPRHTLQKETSLSLKF